MTPAVVFDFGGVLLRWQPLQVLQEVLPELAPDAAAAQRLSDRLFQGFRRGSPWAAFDLGEVDEATLADQLAADTGGTAAQMRRVIDAVPPHLQAQPATVALLRRLRAAGHRMYFLSNMPAPYAARLEQTHDFIGEFEAGLYSGRVGMIKPERPIFELAMQRFALVPERTVFIDDHPANVETALSLGWQGLHFTSAVDCAGGLRRAGWL